MWGSGVTPATADSGDASAVELGVKFTSDTFGTISGVRFYKSAANTGTHIGSLWTANGTLLASATFTNETASGWQQVNFSQPVPITAEHHLRRRVLRAHRPLLTTTSTTSTIRLRPAATLSTAHRCTPFRQPRRPRTACTLTARRAPSRRTSTATATTTGSILCSRRPRARGQVDRCERDRWGRGGDGELERRRRPAGRRRPTRSRRTSVRRRSRRRP